MTQWRIHHKYHPTVPKTGNYLQALGQCASILPTILIVSIVALQVAKLGQVCWMITSHRSVSCAIRFRKVACSWGVASILLTTVSK